ncbi:MAG: DUF5320 domain-containing protein [Bacillota bacterium]|uniref:DUF5320 domain-containing protein n=1 Tax=Desulforudis sp. DRI-14 TaxID=3459793 RepID=UPI0034773FC4
MPAGDRTGPFGAGPRTGRGLGLCGGAAAPGYTAPGFGQGGRFGAWGFGGCRGGRGRRCWFGGPGRGRAYAWGLPYGPATREDEVETLSEQAAELERALKHVKARLNALRREKNQGEAEGEDEDE